jgi:hypothetical protein
VIARRCCLVLSLRVEDEFAQQLASAGMADPDPAVLDHEQNRRTGVPAADADVVKAAIETHGDGSGLADILGLDAIMGVASPVAWRGFGSATVGGRGGGAAQ